MSLTFPACGILEHGEIVGGDAKFTTQRLGLIQVHCCYYMVYCVIRLHCTVTFVVSELAQSSLKNDTFGVENLAVPGLKISTADEQYLNVMFLRNRGEKIQQRSDTGPQRCMGTLS